MLILRVQNLVYLLNIFANSNVNWTSVTMLL